MPRTNKKTGEINTSKCQFGAPFFAYQREGARYGLSQGCCNHWECARCGEMVAAQHYGRIVEGARVLVGDGEKLAFVTVTCKGKELSSQDAMAGYGEWTNRLLDAYRARAIRVTKNHPVPEYWAYAQVTEKQKRSHPHSHFLLTTVPQDTVLGVKDHYDPIKGKIEVPALRSDWLEEACKSAGLGEQYDISEVGNVEACARYVAKYMFKPEQFKAKYPPNWKRVRYSQNWPKLPTRETNAFVVMTIQDWANLSSLAAVVDAERGDAHKMAMRYLHTAGCLVNEVA